MNSVVIQTAYYVEIVSFLHFAIIVNIATERSIKLVVAVVDESLPVSLLDCKVLGCRVEFALRCTKPDKLKTRKEKLLLDFRKRTMSSVQIQNGTGLEQQVNF